MINWLALRKSEAAHAGREGAGEEEQLRTAEALHRRHLAAVFAYVARRVPDRQEAEDVTAEVFAAAFAALPRRKGPQEAYPWLLGIARRKVVDSLRRQARRAGGGETVSEGLAAPLSAGPEAVLAQSERARRLRDLLAGLPPDQREALLLHYVEELPHAQVAAVLGRSPSAVNSLLQRARAAVYRQGRDYFLEESEASQ